jgi:hypothetical protein
MGELGLDSSSSGYEPVVGPCEYSEESSGYRKCREFLKLLVSLNLAYHKELLRNKEANGRLEVKL